MGIKSGVRFAKYRIALAKTGDIFKKIAKKIQQSMLPFFNTLPALVYFIARNK